ncbi:MAG: RNA methyltransferase [Chloroflexota bacterium]
MMIGDSLLNWISGIVSVQTTVNGGNREVTRILVQQDRLDGPTARLQQSAREKAIPLERVEEAVLRELAGQEHHGGVLAEVGPRQYLPLDELIEGPEVPAIIMLDGVEDPYNLGQAIRSLYAAGVTGLVLRSRKWLSSSDTIIRASAGASELMPTSIVDGPESAMTFFRAQGLIIMAATRDDAVPMYDAGLQRPFFLMIGGERRGISRGLQRQADVRVSIPYGRSYGASLGASAASAVLGFEILRQRTGLDQEA